MCSAGGTVSAVAGTACGTLNWTRASAGLPPVKPSIPAGSILLGEVYVPGNATSLSAGNLTDKTVLYVPSPGTLLATKLYAPATVTTYALTGTLAAVDGTNASLALVVPASGIVDVVVQAAVNANEAAASTIVFIGLLNHSGAAQLGLTNRAATLNLASLAATLQVVTRFHLTGLTPGALQIDLAAAFTGAGASANIFAQGVAGIAGSPSSPLLIQAFAAL